MSIGALARASGVPADTLRTWERRYGFPSPERTDTGHRRYSLQTLERLRLVKQALELGHRPSSVLATDEEGLRGLLAAVNSALAPSEQAPLTLARDADVVERWLGHVARFEVRAFERELRLAVGELGGLPFLERLVGPFLVELGERWVRGALGVRHEHFASERLRELLASEWRPLSDSATGATVVCATPASEQHTLGLHMAAFALALQNARIVFLGADCPALEIVGAVEHHAAEAVVLSAAQGVDRARLEPELATLRSRLRTSVPIVGGGSGFQPPLAGVVTVRNLFELVEWWSVRG
jgi:methanogenic corrinoid protein MtbC1